MNIITNQERINTLKNYQVLDTPTEEEFNAITRIASYVCQAPVSLITFIDKDRQWFKSAIGVGEMKETPLSVAFCTHTIASDDDYMIVNDLTKDERFVNNPFVEGEPHVKFYAGVSLKAPNGQKLGTVCVFDVQPKELDEGQLDCLKILSRHVISMLEERKKNRELASVNASQKSIIDQLEQFSYAIAHDIKAPLRTMSMFSSLLSKRAKTKLNGEEIEFLDFIKKGAKDLSIYTNRLLHFAKESTINTSNAEEISLKQLFNDVELLLNREQKVMIHYPSQLPNIFTSKTGLRQILKNIIGNSIKYRQTNIAPPEVHIHFSEEEKYYRFKVSDNGIGMSSEQLESVFQLFRKDTRSNDSTGIGLNVVKRLIEKMKGTLNVQSELGKGTTVEFTIQKITK